MLFPYAIREMTEKQMAIEDTTALSAIPEAVCAYVPVLTKNRFCGKSFFIRNQKGRRFPTENALKKTVFPKRKPFFISCSVVFHRDTEAIGNIAHFPDKTFGEIYAQAVRLTHKGKRRA